MKKFIKGYKDTMAYIAVLGLVGFIACVLIQVISRTFLPTSPNWTEEAARYLFIYMVAFAGNAAVISDEYVGVELLTETFPMGVQKLIKTLITIALFIFSVIIFYFCVIGPQGLLAVTPPAMKTTAMGIPMKYIYYSMIILFGFYILSYAMRLYMLFADKKEEM